MRSRDSRLGRLALVRVAFAGLRMSFFLPPYHRRLPSGRLLELLADRPRSAPDPALCSLVSTIPTSAAATATVTTVAATTAATTIANHLSQARINLLLGLLEDIDKITSLLLVCLQVISVCV